MASDAELLIQSRYDPSAFDEIYLRHARKVHAYLARRLGGPVAEDLVSEVFLRALAARRRSVPHLSGSALPWLYGIARNVIREHYAQRPIPLISDVRDTTDWSSVDDRLDADALSPDLWTAIKGLSGPERDVLLLVTWEQLTVTEAAEALGITPGAARTRLHRARTHAAAALAATQQPVEAQEI